MSVEPWSDDDEAVDVEGLQSLVSEIDQRRVKNKNKEHGNAKRVGFAEPDMAEFHPESEYNITLSDSKRKLDVNDVLQSMKEAGFGHYRNQIAPLLSGDTTSKPSSAKILAPPLAQRQQNKLDRVAAYEQTKEELSKWQDTVKANREADNLSFPLNDLHTQIHKTEMSTVVKPRSALEKNIDSILQSSGLKSEAEITNFGDVELSKLTVAEVAAKRDQLAFMKELMYREQQKGRRINKIKSKSFHRIRRKEQQRKEAQLGEEQGGAKTLDYEAERARERMTLKHSTSSRWAKQTRKLAAHGDFESKQAITEYIQRGEALRQKMSGADNFVHESDEEVGAEGDDEESRRDELQSRIEVIRRDSTEESVKPKGVMSMKFMQDAMKAEKERNEEALLQLQNEIDNPEEALRSEPMNEGGRKRFGDAPQKPHESQFPRAHNLDLSDEDYPGSVSSEAKVIERLERPAPSKSPFASLDADNTNANPWLPEVEGPLHSTSRLQVIGKYGRNRSAEEELTPVAIDVNKFIEVASKKRLHDDERDEDDAAYEAQNMAALSQKELVSQAFAGDDVVNEFAIERDAAQLGDAPREEDVTLPGWGSWTGDGAESLNGNRSVHKRYKQIPGLEVSRRKDANLANVIINERPNEKLAPYLVKALPYPYETIEQYERSLRLAAGKEWSTRTMAEKLMRPRVTIKSGAIIDPIEAPFSMDD